MSYDDTHLFSTIEDNLNILIHSKQSPTEEGWAQYLLALKNHRFTAPPKVLVISDGAGPTPTQRQSLAKATGGAPYFCSIIADAANIRFIAASLALANPSVKSFFPNQLNEALTYLQLTPAQIEKIKQLLATAASRVKNDALQKAVASGQ
jgi:hypothetical protein